MPYEPIDPEQRKLWLILFWSGVATLFLFFPVGLLLLLSAGMWWAVDLRVRTRKIPAEYPPVPSEPAPPQQVGPWVTFTMDPESGRAPLEVHLDATPLQRADDPIVGLQWHFGDGVTVSSGGEHLAVSRPYAEGGKHRIRLTVRYRSGETKRTRRTLDLEPPELPVRPPDHSPAWTTFEMRPDADHAPVNVRFDATPLLRPDDPVVELQWDFGDWTKRSTGDRPRTSRRYAEAGKYVVHLHATFASGESRRVRRTLHVRAAELDERLPEPRFSVSPEHGKAPLSVTLDASSSSDPAGQALTFHWRLGDGSEAEGPRVDHRFDREGNYTIALTVRNAHQKSARIERTLVVAPPVVSDPVPQEPPVAEPPVTEPQGPAEPPAPVLRSSSALAIGVVRHRDQSPLAGVAVTHVGGEAHTVTGPDGHWELELPRGYVVLRFEAEGFLPSQRQIRLRPGPFPVADVTLVPLDESVSSVVLTDDAPMQVARGARVVDAHGERTSTLLFPRGVRAVMRMPDGTSQPLERMSVRATEYTVGPHGPSAMPAELPPGVAYTYCVELSIDEALRAGASDVRFDRPVIQYVENFLGFPVGGQVPVGWYDAASARWVPSANGRVVRVWGIEDGLATLDVDGSGSPAGLEALAALGIEEPELRHLAALYTPDQTLWRAPIPHFSPWDLNWPFGPPEGAQPPPEDPPRAPGEHDPCPVAGSILELRNQALGERVELPGTPYALIYWSRRAHAYAPARTVDIPLVGDAPPDGVRRVDVEVTVAGQRFTEAFPPTPRSTWRFVWDGRDWRGHPCDGAEMAVVRVGYTYEGVYREPARAAASFGMPSDVALTGSLTRQEVTLWREWPVVLGQARQGELFPGWQLDMLHAYDRHTETLTLGDGRTVTARGRLGFERIDGVNASRDAVVAPDGSLLLIDPVTSAVCRVRADGRVDELASGLDNPHRIALGPDGAILVAERCRVVRVEPGGAVTTLAGGASPARWREDGALATESFLFEPSEFAVAADDSIYLAENAGGVCIRRVRPDGRLQTVFSPEVAAFEAGSRIIGLVGDTEGVAYAVVRHTVEAPGADWLLGWSIQRFEPGRPPAVLLRRDAKHGSYQAPPSVLGTLPGAVLVAERTKDRVEVLRITPDGSKVRHVAREADDVHGTADGTLFVRAYNPEGRKLGKPGRWSRVAPDGTVTPAPDTIGEASSEAYLAMAPDGTVCFMRPYGPIVRVVPGARREQVVGSWIYWDWEDVDLDAPVVLPLPDAPSQTHQVGVDGSLYLLDTIRAIVHKVDPEGRASVVAGVLPSERRLGDGHPATAAVLPDHIDGLTVGPDGAIFIAHGRALRRVGTDGMLSTVPWRWPYEMPVHAYYDSASVLRLEVTSTGDLVIACREGVLRLGTAGCEPVVAFARAEGQPANLAVVEGSAADVRLVEDGSGLLVLFLGKELARLDASGRTSWWMDLEAADLRVNLDRVVAGERHEFYLLGAAGAWRPDEAASVATGIAVPSPDEDEAFIFDRDGRHLRTIDARTGATLRSFEYERGRLVRIVEAGRATRIEWTSRGAAVVAPSGARTEAHLNGGALEGLVLPGGADLRFTYERGLLATFTDARGATHRFTYDDEGRIIEDEDGEGGRTSIRRTELSNGFEITTTSALGVTSTERVERLPSGELLVQKRCGGGLTETRSNKGARMTKLPDGSVVTIEFPPVEDDRPKVKTRLEVSGRSLTRTITWVEDPDPTNPGVIQRSQMGERIDTIEVRRSGIVCTTPAGRRSEITSDSEAGALDLRIGSGPALRVAFQGERPMETVLGDRRVAIRYDALGRPIEISGPDRAVQFAYDDVGRLIEETAGDATTRFAYDRAGDLMAVCPPGRPAHRFEYTRLGQIARYIPPGEGDRATGYGYDADGRLASIQLPSGGTVTFIHDADGRLASIRTPADRTDFTYADGTLARIAGPSGIELRYRHEGHLPVEEAWDGSVRGKVAWLYDERFRRAGTRVNDEPPVRLAYDADDLLVGAGELAIERGPDGAIRRTRIGELADSWDHDALGRPERYRVTHAGEELLEMRWVRNTAGRIVEEHETVAGTSRVRRYTYDDAGRLGGDGAAMWRHDVNGNRVEERAGGAHLSGRVDNRDQLLEWGPIRLEHDASGAVIGRVHGDSVTRYGWDARCQLTTVELPNGRAVEYLFDGQNRRVGRKVDGQLTQGWLYDGGGVPVAELDSEHRVVARFVFGTRAHVPDYMLRDGRTWRLVTDARGSIRLVVDVRTGEVAQELDYDAWGRILRDTRPGFQPFGFAGGIADPLTGLVHFGSRSYDPELGRWLSPDPILFAGGTNLYAYCDGDPVNRIDPAGTIPLAVLLPIIAGVIGAGFGAYEEAMKEPECREYLWAMSLGFGLGAGGTAAMLLLETTGASVLAVSAISSIATSWIQMVATMAKGERSLDVFRDLLAQTVFGTVTGVLVPKMVPTRTLSPQTLLRWRMPKSVPQSNRVGHFKPDTWRRMKAAAYGSASWGAVSALWNKYWRDQKKNTPKRDADRFRSSWKKPGCC